MHIRHAIPADLDYCLELDASFETGHVWQLDLRESREQAVAQVRMTALPRLLRVAYPAPTEALLMHWQRGYCILVAEDEHTAEVFGYVDVGPEPDLQLGWLWHLVVDQAHRRQGVGSSLLRAAMQWGREHELARLMAPLQTQNHGGVRFLQRHGFTFCGFNDRYYRSGGIALYFGRNLR